MGSYDDRYDRAPWMQATVPLLPLGRTREEAEREEARLIADAKADAKAVWLLAEHLMPPDVKEFGALMKIEATLQEVWRNAFIAGFRANNRE